MKIVLGADHRGAELVRELGARLTADGHDTTIEGRCDGESCDYPDSAYRVSRAVAGGRADLGILACGSGNGVAMSANKVDGVRAALAYDADSAEMSRRHNDANVLCLAADRLATDEALEAVRRWLAAAFEGGRHARRVRKITAIERGEDPANIDAPQAADS
jgi:ribose 5-phosphate isomerase B